MTVRQARQNAVRPHSHADRLPLSGVRILDLTDEAVVLAPRLLADLGATVIRVEPPHGDGVRRRGPFVDATPGLERSLAHLLYNAGKKSVALALERADAWHLVDRLARSVDVLIAPLEKSSPVRAFLETQGSRPQHTGVGMVDVVFRRELPHLTATDLIGVAAGGLLYLNGFPDDPPNMPAGKLAYKQASLTAALSAMSLVMARRRTGGAGCITVSMQEAVMLTTLQTANENYWHWHRMRPGRAGLNAIGGRSIYQTQDGLWVSFTVPPPYWRNYASWIADVTGCDEFEQGAWLDQRYQMEHAAHTSEMTAILCASMPRDELVEAGQRRHLLVLPVNSVADIASDAHLRERGFFAEIPYPQLDRTLTMPVPPFLSSSYPRVTTRAPMLGEHSVEILQGELGLDERMIAQLISDGVVKQALTTIAS